VIAVGAFDRNFVKPPYSIRQRYVMLTAPGRGVVAAAPSGYQTMDSTWAASAMRRPGSPHSCGPSSPDLTAAQAMQAMTHGTMYWRPDGLSTGSGYGAVDAAKAITEARHHVAAPRQAAAHGALPRRQPATPSVPSNIAVILRDLLGDGFISAAVLACLLVPIMWYGSIIKRRDRRVALAAADRAQHSMAGVGTARDGRDGRRTRLLDFFGPQEAPTGIAAGSRSDPCQGSAVGPSRDRPCPAGRRSRRPLHRGRCCRPSTRPKTIRIPSPGGMRATVAPMAGAIQASGATPLRGAAPMRCPGPRRGMTPRPKTPSARNPIGQARALATGRLARIRANPARCGTHPWQARRRGNPRPSRPGNCHGPCSRVPARAQSRPGFGGGTMPDAT